MDLILDLLFIIIKKNKEIPRDNADMSNEKDEQTSSPKAYGILVILRSLRKCTIICDVFIKTMPSTYVK